MATQSVYLLRYQSIRSAARGPIGLHSFSEQYPYIVDQLLLNSAESYPALFGKITAPILQIRVFQFLQLKKYDSAEFNSN